MNEMVGTFIASKLRELSYDKMEAYIASDGSLALDLLNSPAAQRYGPFLSLIKPDDFSTAWVRDWFKENRPDLWPILSTPEGERWLQKTCMEVRMNLRRMQNP